MTALTNARSAPLPIPIIFAKKFVVCGMTAIMMIKIQSALQNANSPLRISLLRILKKTLLSANKQKATAAAFKKVNIAHERKIGFIRVMKREAL